MEVMFFLLLVVACTFDGASAGLDCYRCRSEGSNCFDGKCEAHNNQCFKAWTTAHEKPLTEKGCNDYKFQGCEERDHYFEGVGSFKATVCACKGKSYCNLALPHGVKVINLIWALLVFIYRQL